MAPLLDGVFAVAVVGDDPVATRAVARGLAQVQALQRRVFIANLTGDDSDQGEVGPGVSDMIRFGVSLGRAAAPSSESPNLFTISGGAETPLAEDVLGSPRWSSLSEQMHRGNALLLLAVPAHAPSLVSCLAQLDGALLVADADAPPGANVLGEVRTAATMRTPSLPTRTPPAGTPPRSRRGLWVIAALALATLAFPQVRLRISGWLGRAPVEASATAPAPSPATDPLAVAPRLTSDAAWSAEVRYVNSRPDAAELVSTIADSLPAATFADVRSPGDSVTWYRVVVGAFGDSIAAENFLESLRTRGTVQAGAGQVWHTPFALLVDSASDNTMARVRVAGYQGRGLPAYALRDTSSVWRIYVGAFGDAADASRFKASLDSSNIQSTLAIRVGSSQ